MQEAFSGCTYYNCNVAVVMTNSYFTDSAKNLAQKTNVLLWDRNTLLKMANRNIFTPKNEAPGYCVVCDSEISNKDLRCPVCGKIQRKPPKQAVIVLIIFLFFISILFIFGDWEETNIETESYIYQEMEVEL